MERDLIPIDTLATTLLLFQPFRFVQLDGAGDPRLPRASADVATGQAVIDQMDTRAFKAFGRRFSGSGYFRFRKSRKCATSASRDERLRSGRSAEGPGARWSFVLLKL